MFSLISKLASGVAAIGVIGGAAVYLDAQPVLHRDLTPILQQLASENQSLVLLQWQVLDAKLAKNGSLDFADLQTYCSLARQLGFVRIPVCGF